MISIVIEYQAFVSTSAEHMAKQCVIKCTIDCLSSVPIAALAVHRGARRMSKRLQYTLKGRQKPTTGAIDEVLMRAMSLSFALCSLEKVC